MKKLTFIVLCSVLLCSCHGGPSDFTIHGTVNAPEGKSLEGKLIFLVPVPVVEENIDSTVIRHGKFEFKGDTAYMAELRIEMKHRMGTENLLVVTEPGDIYVTVGPVSYGGGTPQNDSLQVWKELTQANSARMRESHNKKRNKVYREEWKARTLQLAENVGSDSVLGRFLLGLYGQ